MQQCAMLQTHCRLTVCRVCRDRQSAVFRELSKGMVASKTMQCNAVSPPNQIARRDLVVLARCVCVRVRLAQSVPGARAGFGARAWGEPGSSRQKALLPTTTR